MQNSAGTNAWWTIRYDFSTPHDDYLYTPSFSVVDEVTDAFNFKGWSSDPAYLESINLYVLDANAFSIIATLESNMELPPLDDDGEATIFTYDLSTLLKVKM